MCKTSSADDFIDAFLYFFGFLKKDYSLNSLTKSFIRLLYIIRIAIHRPLNYAKYGF